MEKDKFGPPLDSFCPQFWRGYSATSPVKNLGHNAPLPEDTF